MHPVTTVQENEEVSAPSSSASKGRMSHRVHRDSMLVMSADVTIVGYNDVDYNDVDDDGGFVMDEFDTIDDTSPRCPPLEGGIPPMISLTLVPDTPIVAIIDSTTSSTGTSTPSSLTPHHHPLSFGVPDVPNTTIAKLKPCTSTGDLHELLEKAEMEHVEGITPTTGGGMRRSTSLVSFKEVVKMEHIDNFTLELKKREKRSVWYTNREMQAIQYAALEKQIIEKEDKEALEKKTKKNKRVGRRASLTKSLKKKSTRSNSITKTGDPSKEDVYDYEDADSIKSSNSNTSKTKEKRRKSWSEKAKVLFSSN